MYENKGTEGANIACPPRQGLCQVRSKGDKHTRSRVSMKRGSGRREKSEVCRQQTHAATYRVKVQWGAHHVTL